MLKAATPVFSQIRNKHIVTGKHHTGNCSLTQKRGCSQPAHIFHITPSELHTLSAELHAAEMDNIFSYGSNI